MDTSANRRRLALSRSGALLAPCLAAVVIVSAGCETLPQRPVAQVAPPAKVEARIPQQPVAPPKQAETAVKPMVATVKPTVTAVQPKPAPAMVVKGAEKLSVPPPRAPQPPAAAEQPAIALPQTEAPAPAVQAVEPAPVEPPAELIITGTPRQEKRAISAKKVVMWVGLGIIGAVVAVLVTVVRRPQAVPPTSGKKIDPMRADGMLTKEPLEQL